MTSSISAWIWSEKFWLPENVSWSDLEHPPPGVEYPRLGHLLPALPLAVGVLLLRLLFERLVAKPCSCILQIQAGVPRRAQPNAVLERLYQSNTCPNTRQLEGLSKQLDWDERKIQRWFRVRRNQDRPSMQKKFCESMWRFTFYLVIFIYAISHLWVSPWMWDLRQCWHNYPFQPLSPEQYGYYVAELAFYWSLMLSQFTDIKRKHDGFGGGSVLVWGGRSMERRTDLSLVQLVLASSWCMIMPGIIWQEYAGSSWRMKDFIIMLVHHLATIFLITFSYANNMLRAGTLVMCVHDASDIFLEAAKLANYAKYQKLCDCLFVLFSIIFFVTRLVIFPFWIVYSVLFDSWEIIGPYRAWWLLNGLLLVLQTLHIIWFYLITRIAIKAIFKGKVAKDDRSDIESSSDDEVCSSNGKNHCQTSKLKDNGHTSDLNGETHDH